MVKIRRYTGYVLLFLAVVMADAWLFHSLQEMTDRKTEDVSDTVRADMVYFPVPESSYDTNGYGVSFSDSWMDARNFGGERYHEGCDIMAAIDKRGHYPVVSISECCLALWGIPDTAKQKGQRVIFLCICISGSI